MFQNEISVNDNENKLANPNEEGAGGLQGQTIDQ